MPGQMRPRLGDGGRWMASRNGGRNVLSRVMESGEWALADNESAQEIHGIAAQYQRGLV